MSLEFAGSSEVVDLSAAQDDADRITAFWHRTVEGIRDMCREVAASRARRSATEFRLMWQDQSGHVARPIPLGYNAGKVLAKVGENDLLMGGEYIHRLPASWGSWVLLDRLEQHDHARFVAAVEGGEISTETQQSDLSALLAKWRYENRRSTFWDGAATDGEDWQMHRGDFRDVTLDEPVDAILTDPPYPDEHLPLWTDLGKWAADHLRPGGVLLAWSGVRRLPEILPALADHLAYGWTMMLELPGSQARVIGGNLFQTWKPVLVYVKDHWPPHDWGPDRLTSPQREKSRYEWEQNVEPAINALERFVAPGGLVVDPFCGVGTFGIAALRSGRRFVGIELDEQRHAESCQRLEQWST